MRLFSARPSAANRHQKLSATETSYQEVSRCCIYVAWAAFFLNEHLNSQNEIIVGDHQHNWMRAKQFHAESRRVQIPLLIFIAIIATPSQICAVGELKSIVPGAPSRYSVINLRALDGLSRDELNPCGRLSWAEQPLCTYAVCNTPNDYRHPGSRQTSAALRGNNAFPLPPQGLQVGDHIRILRVPNADLKQREDELARGAKRPGYTADTIERMIAQNPVVKIWQIDEFGYPWYEVSLIAENGEPEEPTLMVYDDGTWEKADR